MDEKINFDTKNSQSLIQLDKMATLGENISAIAHQWREPLMEISALMMQLDTKIAFGKDIQNSELSLTTQKVNEIIKFLSNTIDDFKNFYSTNKQKERFNIAKEIGFIISLINTSLKKEKINIEYVIKKNIFYYGYKNEFLQVILNILVNSKYELSKLTIERKFVKIVVDSNEDFVLVSFEDNAQGIKVNPVNKIFQPYFSTKKEEGTGMGLFMSKMIIEKNMKGILEVKNTDIGAMFVIKLPLLQI